jgi:hypothetical protein
VAANCDGALADQAQIGSFRPMGLRL